MNRKIKIGYLKSLPESQCVSKRVIENNFLSLLSQYSALQIIPFGKIRDIEKAFRRIKRSDLDYIYISSFNTPIPPLWIREKLGVDIPLIFYTHTIYQWFERYVYSIPFLRAYDRIFAPSEYARQLLLKLSSKLNIDVVPHCTDLDSIRGQLSGSTKRDAKNIIFMGRLIKEKGAHTLIELLPDIIKKIDAAHLIIIGPLSGQGMTDSPKSPYVRDLERLVKKQALGTRVTFKGIQTGLKKYEILSESRLFINPTLAREETFGIVNIEALACGVPVIATDWAGNGEIIKNNSNGYLLKVYRDEKYKPYFNRKQLLSLIIMVLGDEKLNLRLKKNAAISAEKYDYHRVIPHLVNLLKDRRTTAAATGKWDFLKDKAILDLRHYFDKDALFFIPFLEKRLRTATFSSLYDGMIKDYDAKNNSFVKSGSGDSGGKKRENDMITEIQRDFSRFFTSV